VYVVSAGVGGQRTPGTRTPTRQAIVATAEHTTVTLQDVKSLTSHVFVFVGNIKSYELIECKIMF